MPYGTDAMKRSVISKVKDETARRQKKERQIIFELGTLALEESLNTDVGKMSMASTPYDAHEK